ncbi:putative ATP-binding protein YheS [Azospirillaceae bacterium]
MLQINDLVFRFGGRVLFDQATAVIPKGHRVALIGRNGTGKTTLLRLIAGELSPDGGSIATPPGYRIGVVAQEAPGGDQSLLDAVLAADTERTGLLAEAEHAHDPHRIAEIHTRLADIEAHTAPARAAEILTGLGFDSLAQARPCRDFSGGWRMRVALAGMLFSQPDLLLLDEPTNHLDLEATMWLEAYLRHYPHTILMVSHDRELLNAVPTTTVHLDQGKLTTYSGGYDQFERARRANLERMAAMQTRQAAHRRHLQSFIDRFRYKATKARQAQSRIKMLEKLEPIVGIVEEHTPRFNFPDPDQSAPPLMTLENVAVGYNDQPVLRRLNLRIDPDDRIALLGANGNGKSTLIKLLAKRLAPLSGEVRRSSRLRVGYFAQHQAEELVLDISVLDQARLVMPNMVDEKIRAHLGRFGFSQERVETLNGRLSGGEKARLLLALMSREIPHIIMLDEPTNHLDIDSRTALIEAINAFEGAVLLISHDPHLISLCADRLWLVDQGTCSVFEGDMEDYRRLLVERARTAGSSGNGEKGSGDVANSRRDQRRAAAEMRAAVAPLKRRIMALEKKMADLTERRRKIDITLADPALYNKTGEEVSRVQIERGDVEKRLAAMEEEWLEASAELEEAMSGDVA